MEIIEPNDQRLYRIAKKRAGFKMNLVAYVLVNLFLIGVWYYSSGPGTTFWPIWSFLGWGLGLAFHYFEAYIADTNSLVEREYQKLKEKEGL